MAEDATIEAWRLRGLSSASALRLPISEINASAAILSNALGEQALADLANRVDKAIALPLRAHPIGQAISTPGNGNIVTVVELAAYLVEFADDPAFREVASALVGQYYSTLPQLAVAYRMKRVGAACVTLEPELPGGRRADIRAEYLDKTVVVECYRPTVAGRPQHHESFVGTALLGLVSDWSEPVAIGILVRRTLDMDLRRRVVAATKGLLRSVRNRSFTHSEYHRDTEFEITVAPTVFVGPGEDSAFAMDIRFPRDLGEPTFSMRMCKAPKAEVDRLEPRLSYPTGSCLGVWETEPRPKLPMSSSTALRRLLQKARKKMGQTKTSRDNLRVMVLDSWVTDHIAEIEDAAATVSSELLRHHDGELCVICIRRSWDSDRQRFRYAYRPFVTEVGSVGKRLASALAAWEDDSAVPSFSSA